jgi:cytochrome c peroxidase
MTKAIYFILLFGVSIGFKSCCKTDCDDPKTDNQPTPYNLVIPSPLPPMDIPADNPLTEEGVSLGRMLFHEPLLSGDESQSCASCHSQTAGFTDTIRFSTGIDGLQGGRNAMVAFNLGWSPTLFWDGRASSLEDQALSPVVNPIEMHESWANAAVKLNAHSEYPELFKKAFDIDEIDSTYVVKAIAQFERTLVSGNSKWDKFARGETILTEQELRGWDLFNVEGPYVGADCFHCHTAPHFTDFVFHNNGLDTDGEFTDFGLFEVTQNEYDKAKFKTPTLRNIAVSGPYMHDGRFETLEEVIEHYNSGGHASATVDPLMKNIGEGLLLSPTDKQALLAFLRTLTDEEFLNNPQFSNPFE